jgi:hypothetical protein
MLGLRRLGCGAGPRTDRSPSSTLSPHRRASRRARSWRDACRLHRAGFPGAGGPARRCRSRPRSAAAAGRPRKPLPVPDRPGTARPPDRGSGPAPAPRCGSTPDHRTRSTKVPAARTARPRVQQPRRRRGTRAGARPAPDSRARTRRTRKRSIQARRSAEAGFRRRPGPGCRVGCSSGALLFVARIEIVTCITIATTIYDYHDDSE